MSRSFLFKMCLRDGSTPLGQCPEVEVEVDDTGDCTRDAYAAHEKFYAENPEFEIVSWGLKEEVLDMRKRLGMKC